MATYKTKQKKAVMEFIKKGHAYTIEEIIDGLDSNCHPSERPAKSSIYRIVSGLVEEGYLKRQVKQGSRQFAYQLSELECQGSHLHLKCTECGRLIHMDDAVSANILDEVLNNQDFAVDEEQTFILGKCSKCKGK